MNKFCESLFVSAPKELDYLLKTYCKEVNYLTLDDLKHRHQDYLFNIIRMVRRCIETQILNLNNAGIGIFSQFSSLLTLCLNYYNGLDSIESVEDLKKSCTDFREQYQEITDNVFPTLSQRDYLLNSDLTGYDIGSSAWLSLAQHAAMNFEVKGHHVNILIPYPKEDFEYTSSFNNVLVNLFPETLRQYYSFYLRELDSRLFASGRYLHATRERTNMRVRSFDAVVVTHDNMFDDIRPRIKAAANYVKTSGAVIIVGKTTDFKKLDLDRIASSLQDIHVYFYSSQAMPALTDFELCIVVGHIRDIQAPSEIRNLVDIFTRHQSPEGTFTFYGSGQEDRPLFASYDISEAEATVLIPDVRNMMQKVVSSLIPKTIADTRRPLLPFTSGQLGLVLISGDINGIVKEDDTNCCHVVKGSSKQRTDNKEEIISYDDNGDASRIKRTESVYASTNVNIVLPDGKFVELH